MKCSSCGMEFEGVFCPNCGTKNEESEAKPEESANVRQSFVMEKPKKKKNIMATFAFVMGLVSICTLGVFIIPEIMAIIFGACSKKDGERPGTAKAGLICGIVAAVIFVGLMVFGIILSI